MASFPVLERKKEFLAPGVSPSLTTLSKTSQLAAPGDSGSIDARNSTIDCELRDCRAGHTHTHTHVTVLYRCFIIIPAKSTAILHRSADVMRCVHLYPNYMTLPNVFPLFFSRCLRAEEVEERNPNHTVTVHAVVYSTHTVLPEFSIVPHF